MTEPINAVSAASSSAILTAAMAASGLDPVLLFAGLAGGWWSLSYIQEPMPWHRRLWLAVISSLSGAWLGAFVAPPLAALAAHTWNWWPPEAGGQTMRISVALIIGLLAHRQIGPLLIRRAARLDSTGDQS